MIFVKLVVAALVFVVTAAAVTVAYVLFFTRGTKATGVDLLLAMTIHSVFYWLMMVVVLVALWWPLRKWLFK
jgi:hypothetical protein